MILSKNFLYNLLFFLLLLLAISLRLLALKALSETPYYTFLLPDERYYHDWALAVLKGQPIAETFEYAPLPAYFMALVYKIFSADIFFIRLSNILFNIAGCILVFLIARIIVGRYWALLSFAFAACSAELIFYAVVPLKTSLSFFLFALFIYLVLLSISTLSWKRVFAVGLVLGAAMTVRPNALVFLPFIIPVILYFNDELLSYSRMVLVGLIVFLGFICTALPLSLHNFSLTGKFAFLPVQSGFLSYCTNTVNNPTPFYRPVAFASSHPEEQGVHFVIEASKRQGKVLTAKQASRYWQLEVIKEAGREPQQAFEKIWMKTLMLFSYGENSDHYNLRVMAEIVPFFRILQIKFWVFMFFGYTGLVFGFRRSAAIRCISILCLAYLMTLLLYSTGNRFFLPVLAILIPSSTWFIQYVVEKISTPTDYKEVTRIGLLLLVFVFLGKMPVNGSGDLSKHYNTLAFAYKEKGNIDLALRYWQKSNERKETYSDVASLFLAGDDYQRYGPQKAIERLWRIPDSSFMSAAKYSTLGDIYKHHNNLQEALQSYRKSLAINFGQIRAREEITAILSVLNSEKLPGEINELEWVSNFYRY